MAYRTDHEQNQCYISPNVRKLVFGMIDHFLQPKNFLYIAWACFHNVLQPVSYKCNVPYQEFGKVILSDYSVSKICFLYKSCQLQYLD